MVLNVPTLPRSKPDKTDTYLLQVEFSSDDASPVANPYVGEKGGIAIVDSTNLLNVASGLIEVTVAGATAHDPGVSYNAGIGRRAGRTFFCRMRKSPTGGAGNSPMVGWHRNIVTPSSANTYGIIFPANAGTPAIICTPAATPIGMDLLSNSTFYLFAFVLRNSGFYAFIDGKLAWLTAEGMESVLYPGANVRIGGARGFGVDYMRVRNVGDPFLTENGICVVNESAPTAQNYTSVADQILDYTLTAPSGSIGAQAGIIYRRTDANNYWRAYFDTDGSFKVDSVSSGTPTNRVNVASAISAGQTRTIRIICEGSLHDVYTLSGSTYTKRGSQVNVSHQNSATAIRPDIGAGWTSGALKSYARDSALYDVLDAA